VARIHLVLLLGVLLLAGCAARQAFTEGERLIEAGEVEAGLAKVDQAAKLEPRNREYRAYFFRQRDMALGRLLALADGARIDNRWEEAEAIYKRMLGLDTENSRARAGLEAVRVERRERAVLTEAEDLLQKGNATAAAAKVREVLAEDANHRGAQQLLRRIEEKAIKAALAASGPAAVLKKPITLEFRDVPLRQVFELVSRNTGLNFIFDRDVRPDLRTTIFVRNTTMDDVLRFILVTNQLERKTLNPNTLLIYPNSAAKARDYQDLTMKSFYLANADVKQTASMIKALVKTKDLYVDEALNMLVMRDTPEAVRIAEKLVANQDLAQPEVMLELEVLEAGTNLLRQLGIQWPDQFSYSAVGAAGTAGTMTLPEWNSRNAGLVRLSVTNPFLTLNLKDQLGQTNLLANPRIRVRNKTAAKVHIGDKVPVITSTATATGFVSQSVTYLDVGLKLDVEPTVYLENDVGIKVGLEVSSIVQQVTTASGTVTYQIGTRNASTTLRLKDGETQVLAGLINDEDRRQANRVPGLGSLPILGRLFSSHNDTNNKTEVVLLITPRVVRNLARPEYQLEEFPSGTEAAIGAPPLLLQSVPLGSAEPGAAIAPGASSLPAPAPMPGRAALTAPANIAPGQEFTVLVSLELDEAMRSGLLDLAFDPSRLRFVRAEPGSVFGAASSGLAFRVNAPEGMGRLNVSYSTKTDVRAGGELVRLVFQATDNAAGTPSVRLEALSITSAAGKIVSAQLPPAVSFNISR